MQRSTMTEGSAHATGVAPDSMDAVIYIVDDDAAVRAAVRLLVEAHGWQAQALASAEEFLLRYDRHRPGCLVLDLSLCGQRLSALELQAIIANLALPVCVIMITADDANALAARARAAGAMRVLAKPFREADLISGICRALQRHS